MKLFGYLMLTLKITWLKEEMLSLISYYYMPHESKVTVNSKHLVRNVLDLFMSPTNREEELHFSLFVGVVNKSCTFHVKNVPIPVVDCVWVHIKWPCWEVKN